MCDIFLNSIISAVALFIVLFFLKHDIINVQLLDWKIVGGNLIRKNLVPFPIMLSGLSGLSQVDVKVIVISRIVSVQYFYINESGVIKICKCIVLHLSFINR